MIPITLSWSGPFGTATGLTPTVTLPEGTHTVILTVSDGIVTATDTVSIQVVNAVPIPNAGPDQVVTATSQSGAFVSLDGSGSSDPDGDPIALAWVGPFGTATGLTPTVVLGEGTHTVTLGVSDGTDSATDIVSIQVVNATPSADAGPDQSVTATSQSGASVTLAGSASSDPDGDPITLSWSGTFGTATGLTPTVTLPEGTHTVTLTVSDGTASATDTVAIQVLNATPSADAGPDQSVTATSQSGASVTLAGSASSDPDGDPITLSWSGTFGTATGLTPTVTLPEGTHTVTLTVSDGTASATDTVSIQVLSAVAASDDWESGGFSGGTGWLSVWTVLGGSDTNVTSGNSPYAGVFHLRLRGSDGYASRDVDLSGRTGDHLTFRAKVESFEGGDSATVSVSPDGTNWTVVRTWTSIDSDSIYRFVDIDLGSFAMTSQFFIAFEGNMNSPSDRLLVDNVSITTSVPVDTAAVLPTPTPVPPTGCPYAGAAYAHAGGRLRPRRCRLQPRRCRLQPRRCRLQPRRCRLHPRRPRRVPPTMPRRCRLQPRRCRLQLQRRVPPTATPVPPTATPVPPTATPVAVPLPAVAASDDWESGGFSGGTGWISSWTVLGGKDAKVTRQDSPYAGDYHLRLSGSNGYASRDVDLSGRTGDHLTFRAKVDSFEGSDSARVMVSPDGIIWTVVKTWTFVDSDGIYKLVDIDLSSFTMTSQFFIAFEGNMSSKYDRLLIDNIEVKQ